MMAGKIGRHENPFNWRAYQPVDTAFFFVPAHTWG
jgi:hypothetical protein